MPVSVGGDHIVTLPILRAIAEIPGSVALVHSNAHTDINDHQFGEKTARGTIIRLVVKQRASMENEVEVFGMSAEVTAMNEVVKDFLQKIDDLEDQLQEELHQRSAELQFKIRNGKVTFEHELREKNREFRVGLAQYVRGANLRVVLTAPFIYSLIIPFALLDLFVSVYQAICFPAYGVPKVKRADYLIFDRMKLDYLNGLEKINCAYCSYCNGIIGFVVEVAARTEQYWCPIKHAQRTAAVHARYPLFTDYGDGEQYREKLAELQKKFD